MPSSNKYFILIHNVRKSKSWNGGIMFSRILCKYYTWVLASSIEKLSWYHIVLNGA